MGPPAGYSRSGGPGGGDGAAVVLDDEPSLEADAAYRLAIDLAANATERDHLERRRAAIVN